MPSTIRDPYHRRHFNPDLVAQAAPDIGRPWWAPTTDWPPDMHFDDVDADVLAGEREIDHDKLGPPPAPAGAIGCAAAWCAEAQLAEADIEGPAPLRWEVRLLHPADRARRAARRAAGAA